MNEGVFAFTLDQPPESLSPLTLAFVGDAVYELYVRTQLTRDGSRPPGKLHNLAVRYVNAGAQSRCVHAMLDKLTEAELAVFKRGRNAKSHTASKNADITDYRQATGFEALIGYVFLKKEFARAEELMKLAFEQIAAE